MEALGSWGSIPRTKVLLIRLEATVRELFLLQQQQFANSIKVKNTRSSNNVKGLTTAVVIPTFAVICPFW